MTYQNGPETPYCHATLELCKSVAAHVHELTMCDATRPVRIVRPAVLWVQVITIQRIDNVSSRYSFSKNEPESGREIRYEISYLKCSLVTSAPRNFEFIQTSIVVNTLKKAPKPSTTKYPIPSLNGGFPPKNDSWPAKASRGGMSIVAMVEGRCMRKDPWDALELSCSNKYRRKNYFVRTN